MSRERNGTVGRGTRGYLEIVYSVLTACTSPVLRTHIMFKCNLNSKQLHDYVEALVDKRLIEKRLDPQSQKVEYMTTTRGIEYISTYNRLLEMIVAERQLEHSPFA